MNYLLLCQWNEAVSNECVARVAMECEFEGAVMCSSFRRTELGISSTDLLAPVPIEPNGPDSRNELLAPLELGFESPRLWTWQARVKLLLIASLAFAFLLSLLDLGFHTLRKQLLPLWCHRTGERYRRVEIPLYRLREAISSLWLTFPPRVSLFHSSG
jgi:hypothetical protein